ncbi:unnamed protein product, partial [marine sediment metagenome]
QAIRPWSDLRELAYKSPLYVKEAKMDSDN